MTSSGAKHSHAVVASSVLCIALAVAVWMAAWKRSTPPLNPIPVPEQSRPIASVVHKAPSYAPAGHGFASIERVAHDSEVRGPVEQSLEDSDPDPIDLETVPVEDRVLLGANHRADLGGSSDTPPPTPPRADVDWEPRTPGDPRDFELPAPASRTEP